MNKELILQKLGLTERGDFSILNDKELCNRIEKETSLYYLDFAKEYELEVNYVKIILLLFIIKIIVRIFNLIVFKKKLTTQELIILISIVIIPVMGYYFLKILFRKLKEDKDEKSI